MKKFLKYITAAVLMASAPFGILADTTDAANGARIDFLDAQGNVLNSQFVKDLGFGAVIWQIGNSKENPKVVYSQSSSDDPDVASVRVIPWGRESYSFKCVSDDPDIAVTFEDLTAGTGELTGEATIKCGNTIRIWAKCSNGKYPLGTPKLGMDKYSYTVDYAGLPTSGMGIGLGYDYKIYLNSEYRGYIQQMLENRTGPFTYDQASDRLYLDIKMQNQPWSFEFTGGKPDGTYLRNLCLRALSSLYSQDQSRDWNVPFNYGDAYIADTYGNFMSEDMVSSVCAMTPWIAELFWTDKYDNNPNIAPHTVTWGDCLKWVYVSNIMLSGLDKFDAATQDELDIARAQMLTLRSHAYFRLLQVFGPRWQDSNQGDILVAPLMTEFCVENKPLSSMKEILDQCYSDLDEAIAIFKRTGYKRSNIVEPDLYVAEGVKLRMAQLKEDWTTVDTLADDILDEYPLTRNDGYLAGFFKPEKSWIWGAENYTVYSESGSKSEERCVYYWTPQNFNACNGTYPYHWGMSSNAINRDLYDKIPATDKRRNLFVMPGDGNYENWYDETYVNVSDLSVVDDYRATMAGDLLDRKPSGSFTAAFQEFSGRGPIKIAFGAQTKFFQPGSDITAQSTSLYMRTEEILLSRAEARYHLDDLDGAAADVDKINSLRDPQYQPATADATLIDDIKLCRKVELWGEGHSWFDQKRWNEPMTRRAYKAGDTESGNWPLGDDVTIATGNNNGWRFMIPKSYVNTNDLIDVNALGYSDVSGYENTTQEAPSRKDVINDLRPGRVLTGQKNSFTPVKNLEEAPSDL